MPVMQSFGGLIPQRLAESYGQGVQLTQTDQQREAAQQTAREQMANQYAIAQMESSAKQQALQQEMAQKSQELEIEKAYKQQQIGLAQAENAMKQQQIEAVAQQAQQQFDARRAIEAGVQQDIQGGAMTPQQALTRQVALHGAGANLPSGLVSDLYDQQRAGLPGGAGSAQLQQVTGPDGKPMEGVFAFGTGPRTQQLYEPGKNAKDFTAAEVPGAATKMKIANTVYDSPQYIEFKRLEKNLDALKTYMKQPKWTANTMSLAKRESGEELTAGDRARIKEWNDQMSEIKDLEDKIAPLRRKFIEADPLQIKAPPPTMPFVPNTNPNRGTIRVIEVNPAK